MTTLREAAQMALDALDSDNPDIQLRAATHLRAALAQPEQEPVAWMHPTSRDCVSTQPHSYKDAIPLYTTPPQREWQGLTPEDKRIAGIPLYTDQISMSDAFDVIERILKEKNCAPDK